LLSLATDILNFDDLVPINDQIVAASGNEARFRFTPVMSKWSSSA